MQNQQIGYPHPQQITLYLDERLAFNRRLLSLIRQWDKRHAIEIHTEGYESQKPKTVSDQALQFVDKDGSSFKGPEAVPIILKHLPYGKLAAAMYILPGTMWVTKQLYSFDKMH